MRSWNGVLLLAVGLLEFLGPVAAERPLFRDHPPSAASFDCRRALTATEKLVCGDPQLSEDDGNLDFAYSLLLRHAAPSARAGIREGQRAWLRKRDACAQKSCLLDLYSDRYSAVWGELNRWDRLLRRSVARVGQCAQTTIDWIGPRLSDGPPNRSSHPDGSGTSVALANGVGMVSYEMDRAVLASRVDDPVRVCLVYIPQHCPPHDDRGRIYAVRNLRTGGRWEMPDSQHGCGGA